MTEPAGLQIDGHLVLVGLPGSGKSTVGRAVAKRLSRPFLDFDAELERRAGISVARIFAERGEAAFRGLEYSLTQELAAAPPMVLAPGGDGSPSLAPWRSCVLLGVSFTYRFPRRRRCDA